MGFLDKLLGRVPQPPQQPVEFRRPIQKVGDHPAYKPESGAFLGATCPHGVPIDETCEDCQTVGNARRRAARETAKMDHELWSERGILYVTKGLSDQGQDMSIFRDITKRGPGDEPGERMCRIHTANVPSELCDKCVKSAKDTAQVLTTALRIELLNIIERTEWNLDSEEFKTQAQEAWVGYMKRMRAVHSTLYTPLDKAARK
ncbi:MAG: hypothetical protein NT003_03400 [Candidatus Magasanikbacteria bacterium]|nr:hypothetical protein [Candidatus Magasanikbacteria bacterium]